MGRVADQLRQHLKDLAQSDAKQLRELDQLLKELNPRLTKTKKRLP